MADLGDQSAQISDSLTVDQMNPEIPSTTIQEDKPKHVHIAESKSTTNDDEIKPRKSFGPIKKLDGFISHMNRLIHTREDHDSVILFLACATHFLATALETPISERLRCWATKFGSLVLKNTPTRLATSTPFSKLNSYMTAIHAYRGLFAERARALSNIMDDWQIITRLWGLLAMWAETKEYIMTLTTTTDAATDRNKNPRDYFVSKAIKGTYIVGLISYLGFENLAWLTRRGVLKSSEKTEGKLMIRSLTGWGIFVSSELAQLLHDRSLKKRGFKEEDEESKVQWRRRLVQVLIYGPLTVHWIKDGGLLPEVFASFLTAYAEYITVQGLWKASA
ncbi:unnamed protein product [Fusarium graminearum]|nr:hypothetical protein FGRA07_02374 [Fusarium graminearum]CAG2009449.1 unnamed protein product [Fusarium graminearum]